MSSSVWMDTRPETEGVLPRRVVAWLLDWVLIGLISLALWLVLFVFGIITFGLGFLLMHGLWVVPILYTIGFVASPAGATPGQAMAGLRLVRAQDGGPPNAGEALIYALGYWATIALTGGLLLIAAFFTQGNRALHDIAAGLVMVRRGPPLQAPFDTGRG
jgi:uncharacterized RDD family membrane protein YckC